MKATFNMNGEYYQHKRMVFPDALQMSMGASPREHDSHRTYDTTTRRQSGEVVKANAKTVWVQTFCGTIKRHIRKHNVVLKQA